MNRRKLIVIVPVALVVLFASYYIGLAISHRGLAKLDILVGPSTSTITIDGKKIGDGVQYVSAGKHELKASFPGFTTDSQQVTADLSKTVNVYLSPTPSSEAADTYLKKNPEAQREREAVGGARNAQVQDSLNQESPLVLQLPQTFKQFVIDYGVSKKYPNDPSRIAIYIHAIPKEDRQAALDWMRKQGADPSDYEIIFTDFVNPFERQGD